MPTTDTERNSWVEAVKSGRTDKGLEEWLNSTESLPGDNVVVLAPGLYPMVRIAGVWFQVGHDLKTGAKIFKASDDDVEHKLSNAMVILDRERRVIRGSIHA